MSPAKVIVTSASVLESAAKAAYEKWAYRVGVDAAWENLPVRHMTAWRDVVQLIQTDAECARCGEVLLCVDCDAETIFECPECSKPLDCTDKRCPGMGGEGRP